MRLTILFLSAAILMLLSCTGESKAVEIKNFKAGLVCGVHPERRICFETETIYITGQGRCVFKDEELPCTWYGFEFEYKNAAANEEVTCVDANNKPLRFGNPEQIEKVNSNTFRYSFTLEPGDDRFYNPQYSIFKFQTEGDNEILSETVCSIDDEELFRFKFRIIYPTVRK